MNIQEAKIALREGKRLTHTTFTKEEWVQGIGHLYEFEDGCLCTPEQFWCTREIPGFEDGWSIVQNEVDQQVIKNIMKEISIDLSDKKLYHFTSKHEHPHWHKGRW